MTGTRFNRNFAKDKFNRNITYYITETKSKKAAPLFVFIQGSGCLSNFTKIESEIRGYQNYLLRAAEPDAQVIVVEKPGVSYLDVNSQPGTAIGCSTQFLEEHTLERWAEANLAVIRNVKAVVNPSHILVVGHSEGGMTAAMMAAKEPAISHVALLGTAVGNNLFSSIYLGKHSKNGFEGMSYDELIKKWKEIVKESQSTTKFAWGHPYKRMASFVKHRTYSLLKQSSAKIYIGHGSKDFSSAIEVFDLMVSELILADREFTIDRIEGASHSFKLIGMEKMMERVVKWFYSNR